MTPDDLLIVAQGGGSNGKSTINSTTARAAGGYYALVSDRALLADPKQHPTELMDLQGVRYAVAEETPEARRLSVARLKTVIGTPQVKARRMHKDPVTFDATHSFFLSTNYRPLIEETDLGTWRRLALVKFPFTFRRLRRRTVDRQGDPGLRDRCTHDPEVWAAALAWMVEGARRWYELGRIMPSPPERVEADTREWRTEADQVLAYADDRLVFDPDRHVMAKDLLDDLNNWLEARGHRKWSDKTLAARFGDHDETACHRVEKRKMRYSDAISRPPESLQPWAAPMTYAAWVGLRFATPVDADVPGVPGESLTREAKD